MSEDLFCFEATPGSDVPCDATTLPCECKSPEVLGVAEGISLVYAASQAQTDRALGFGDDYGVSTDVSQ